MSIIPTSITPKTVKLFAIAGLGEVYQAFAEGHGRIKFHGSFWRAQLYQASPETVLRPGELVMVVGRFGLTLLVSPYDGQKEHIDENPSKKLEYKTGEIGDNKIIESSSEALEQASSLSVQDGFDNRKDKFPLLDLFTRIREAGLPLGIDEYQILLRSLQKGFGTSSREALANLCRTLWVKSSDEEHLFNYHFERISESLIPSADTLQEFDRKSENSSSITKTDESESIDLEVSEPLEQQTTSTPISTELMEIEDEIQVAGAVQISTQRKEDEIVINRFTQTDEYFPVTRRQMKQSWRYLRRLVRKGLATELDVEATIDRIVQQGMLLEPVLVPRRVNQTELLLLIDQQGSMVPFHALSQRLAETAQRGGRLGKAGIYYFHNAPTRYVYRDPSRQNAESVADVLAQLQPDRSVVMIFSDAGAARGGFSLERLELTAAFLNQLRQQVRYIAWLNPMPETRWLGTTAGEIARVVPMFEFNRQGMDQAIDVLRGKPIFAGEKML